MAGSEGHLRTDAVRNTKQISKKYLKQVLFNFFDHGRKGEGAGEVEVEKTDSKLGSSYHVKDK